MHIGEHQREIIVEPLENPVPVEQPTVDPVSEPVPDTIPAEWSDPVGVPA